MGGASKEQLATLKKQLKEAQRLRDLAEKAKVEAEKAKAQAERERDEAMQHGYDVGVAETEDALRVEVPTVCRAYCTQTWEEALNRARIDVSSCPSNSKPERGSSSSLLANQRGPTSESSLIQSVGAGQRV